MLVQQLKGHIVKEAFTALPKTNLKITFSSLLITLFLKILFRAQPWLAHIRL